MSESGHVRRLRLLHFRTYLDCEISFSKRPLALFGQNGVGKTNILEALSLFSPGRGLRRADRLDLGNHDSDLGWKLVLEGKNSSGGWIIETLAQGTDTRRVKINAKSASQTEMGNFLRLIWMVPSFDRIWTDQASERRRFFDRIVLSFVPDHGETVLEYEKALRERNRLLHENIKDAHWFLALEDRMAISGARIEKNRALALECLNAEMEAGIPVLRHEFPAARLTLDYSGEEEINQGIDYWRDLWASRRHVDQISGTTRLGPHKAKLGAVFLPKNQNVTLCSTGEQKALLISLFLANAQSLVSQGLPVVLLLDEVAAHLDETRRQALFDVLCDLRIQSVMTGTERNLFSALGARGDFIEIHTNGNVSKLLSTT